MTSDAKQGDSWISRDAPPPPGTLVEALWPAWMDKPAHVAECVKGPGENAWHNKSALTEGCTTWNLIVFGPRFWRLPRGTEGST